MKQGLWVWPADAKAQGKTLKKVSAAPHIVPALTAIAKSKEGMSNSEIDESLADSSEWMTLWVVRQLTSLGFIEYKVDLFGGPAKYQCTELGRNALAAMTGQPAPKPPTPPPAAPAVVAPPAAPAAKA